MIEAVETGDYSSVSEFLVSPKLLTQPRMLTTYTECLLFTSPGGVQWTTGISLGGLFRVEWMTGTSSSKAPPGGC